MKPLRFGGHETFAIREGWLYKGLRLLKEDPDTYTDPLVADYLGVGRNMAKSIWYWLKSGGLIKKGSATHYPVLTELGELVWKYDRYFVDPGTWWVLHANLCGQAAVWHWFFNYFAATRFDRAQALEQWRRFLEAQAPRLPSSNTLSRDLACLLQSYASPIPRTMDDPEEGNDCPLQDLGLLLHYRDSGLYEVVRTQRPIPGPIFGYVFSQAFDSPPYQTDRLQIPLAQVAHAPGSPGRIFALNQDALMNLVLSLEREKWFEVQSLGGDKTVILSGKAPVAWLELYYTTETPYRNVA